MEPSRLAQLSLHADTDAHGRNGLGLEGGKHGFVNEVSIEEAGRWEKGKHVDGKHATCAKVRVGGCVDGVGVESKLTLSFGMGPWRDGETRPTTCNSWQGFKVWVWEGAQRSAVQCSTAQWSRRWVVEVYWAAWRRLRVAHAAGACCGTTDTPYDQPLPAPARRLAQIARRSWARTATPTTSRPPPPPSEAAMSSQ